MPVLTTSLGQVRGPTTPRQTDTAVRERLPDAPRPCSRRMGTFGSDVDPESPTSYLGLVMEDPIIAPSALKHGLDESEILHAYRNPARIWDLGDGFTMIVGPNQSAIFLEIGYVDGDHVHVIVHAMKARQKFLR